MRTESRRDILARLHRRELMASIAGAGVIFAIGAVVKARENPALIRPPKVDSESDFLSKCIKCGRCISACPTHVISSSPWEYGWLSLRTPHMDYRRGGCDFCNKCIEVCPTGALKPYEGETTDIGKAVLTESCIALRTGGCTKCHDICEYGAIILDEQKRPSVELNKCNGCGKCVSACPALVFQSFGNSGTRGIRIRALEGDERQ